MGCALTEGNDDPGVRMTTPCCALLPARNRLRNVAMKNFRSFFRARKSPENPCACKATAALESPDHTLSRKISGPLSRFRCSATVLPTIVV
jgi:hypothetical protein